MLLYFVTNSYLLTFSVEEGTRVHFEVMFEPIFTAVSTGEVTNVMVRELSIPTVFFSDVTTLPETLHIEVSTYLQTDCSLN